MANAILFWTEDAVKGVYFNSRNCMYLQVAPQNKVYNLFHISPLRDNPLQKKTLALKARRTTKENVSIFFFFFLASPTTMILVSAVQKESTPVYEPLVSPYHIFKGSLLLLLNTMILVSAVQKESTPVYEPLVSPYHIFKGSLLLLLNQLRDVEVSSTNLRKRTIFVWEDNKIADTITGRYRRQTQLRL